MADKKYYYLQIESSLFSNIKLMMLDKQKNKKDLLYFLIQISVISIENEGQLLFDDEPANIETLSLLTGELEEDVELWLKTLIKLKLVSKMESTYLVDFASERIGSITERAKRKQRELARKMGGTQGELNGTQEELRGNLGGTCSDEVPTCKSKKLEIELDKELKKDKDIKKEIEKNNKKENIVSKDTLVVLDKPKKPRKDENYYFGYYDLWINFLNLNNNAFKLVKTTKNGFSTMINKIKKFEKQGLTLSKYDEALQESQNNSFLFGDNDRNWKMDILFLMSQDKLANLYAGKYKGSQQKVSEKSFVNTLNNYDDVSGAPF